MTISLAHPEDFGIRAELLDRSRPIEPRLYLYVERELARSTDSGSFFGVLLAAHCLIYITLLRGLSEFIRQYRRPVPIIANIGLGERDPNLPQICLHLAECHTLTNSPQLFLFAAPASAEGFPPALQKW